MNSKENCLSIYLLLLLLILFTLSKYIGCTNTGSSNNYHSNGLKNEVAKKPSKFLKYNLVGLINDSRKNKVWGLPLFFFYSNYSNKVRKVLMHLFFMRAKL